MHHLPAVTGKDNDAVFFDKKNDPKTGSARNLHMFVDHGQLGELDGSQDSHRSNRSNRSASGKNKKVKQQPVPKFEEKNDSQILETPPTVIQHAVKSDLPQVAVAELDTSK